MRLFRWQLLLAVGLPLLGCPPPPAIPDSGQEEEDGGAPDGGEADGGEEKPLVLPGEPAPFPKLGWMVGVSSDPYRDPALRPIEEGTFQYPASGMDSLGVYWRDVTPTDAGSLGTWSSSQIVWAVTYFELRSPRKFVMQADRALDVFVNGVRQPADAYGSGQMRIPLLAFQGANLVAVRGLGGRELRIRLWEVTDEVFLNQGDRTAPDFVVGEASPTYLGIALLNLTSAPLFDAVARVVESDLFEASSQSYPALPPSAVVQLGFKLQPKTGFPDAGYPVPLQLQVESPSLAASYQWNLELSTVAADAVRTRTFLSPDDSSVQKYGVLPPSSFDPSRDYALVLSLHGAGVDGPSLASAFSKKDWTYVVTPTNRRPFGFDWEEWGRMNALFSLDDAMRAFRVDPTRVYLTGHSMGGHGTWHVGLTAPGRFAVLGPSAGWSSVYSYVGEQRPAGPFAWALAHRDTLSYIQNLSRRAAYIIHGSADDNVPVREGRDMYAAALAVVGDAGVAYHEEPGAGHWWDGPASPGTDCVDWPPLFDFMKARTLDPLELDFTFISPSPAYSAKHSFLTLHSSERPDADLTVTSSRSGSIVTLSTTNVRSLEMDGQALLGRGVTSAAVNGQSYSLQAGPLFIGPKGGKGRDLHGPFNQVFHRPFCYVYPDEAVAYARFASYLSSHWAIYGNGLSCALPKSKLTSQLRASHNLIYLGVPSAELGRTDLPFQWDGQGIRMPSASADGGVAPDAGSYDDAALAFVFPEGGRLAGFFTATSGRERYLYRAVPFSSWAGKPDYLVWRIGSAQAAGFFDAEWKYDPGLGVRQ
ncbi:MAG: prolyl oligopeptidase family serine peptidase [Myxococcales bacterium]|nr:prolyl oligopeptidase family serine peptidase [Myxococcales bacterium]